MVAFLRVLIHEFCITEGFSSDFYDGSANWIELMYGEAASQYFRNLVQATGGYYIPRRDAGLDELVDEIVRTILQLAVSAPHL